MLHKTLNTWFICILSTTLIYDKVHRINLGEIIICVAFFLMTRKKITFVFLVDLSFLLFFFWVENVIDLFQFSVLSIICQYQSHMKWWQWNWNDFFFLCCWVLSSVYDNHSMFPVYIHSNKLPSIFTDSKHNIASHSLFAPHEMQKKNGTPNWFMIYWILNLC